MSQFVIPIFIAHQGCPHRCVFCDQFAITGNTRTEEDPVGPADVRKTIDQWLKHYRGDGRDEVQAAFYGGSFTGLPIPRQAELLGAVKPYIDDGRVGSIRLSTRPDYLDEAIVALLKANGVAIVELGIQSLDPDVLKRSARGHSAAQSENAVRLLRKNGFMVGVQLMCGLPGDTTATLMATVRKVVDLAPDFVRIYPAVIIRGSGLEKLYRDGGYRAMSLLRAVALAGRMREIFHVHGVKVVRMGLQPSPELAEKVVAGPYHPAFGELVLSRALFRQARKLLRSAGINRVKRLAVAARDESAFRGPENVNMKRLAGLGLLAGVEIVFDKEQERNTVKIF